MYAAVGNDGSHRNVNDTVRNLSKKRFVLSVVFWQCTREIWRGLQSRSPSRVQECIGQRFRNRMERTNPSKSRRPSRIPHHTLQPKAYISSGLFKPRLSPTSTSVT